MASTYSFKWYSIIDLSFHLSVEENLYKDLDQLSDKHLEHLNEHR